MLLKKQLQTTYPDIEIDPPDEIKTSYWKEAIHIWNPNVNIEKVQKN